MTLDRWAVSRAALICLLVMRTGGAEPPTDRPAAGQPPDGAAADVTPKAVVDAHVAQLRQLHEAVKAELPLTDEQKAAIDALFEAHIRTVTTADGRRPFGVNADDAKAIEELRKRLSAAREAGDQEAVRKLTAEFRELIRSRRQVTGLTTDQFFARVILVLDKEQTEGFRRLIKRLRIGDARGRPADELVGLWRAVLSPEVGLSDEQRRAVHSLRVKASRASAEARKNGDEDRITQINNEIRGEVMARLTPEQREKVEALLARPAKQARTAGTKGTPGPPVPTADGPPHSEPSADPGRDSGAPPPPGYP
jgi:Spy/CpxP family protein refolding chaperone